jgi:hypothetical protein
MLEGSSEEQAKWGVCYNMCMYDEWNPSDIHQEVFSAP